MSTEEETTTTTTPPEETAATAEGEASGEAPAPEEESTATFEPVVRIVRCSNGFSSRK